jgi:inner membrane protein
MDNVTHTLFALILARTSLGRAGRGTAPALVLASNAPDVDVVAAAGGTLSYIQWHRGPTHGILGVIALGLLTAAIVTAGRRFWNRRNHRESERGDASFATLTAISMIGVLLHILMDLPTSYGTRMLSPFDWHWYTTDWLPIVDVYLMIALAAGLVLGRGSEATRRRAAAAVLLFMAANYGVRAASHHRALKIAPRLFGLLLPPCDQELTASVLAKWPRPADVTRASDPAPSSAGGSGPQGSPRRCLREIAAMPDFRSPFRWQVIAQMSDFYELHDLDLFDSRFRDSPRTRDAFWRVSVRYPNQWTPLVIKAATTRPGRVFLGFSRFPAARSILEHDGFSTVRLTDMRFVGERLGTDQPATSVNLFTATVRFAPDGSVLLQPRGR